MADLVEVPFEGGTMLFAAAGSSGPQAFAGAGIVAKAAESLDDVLEQVCRLGEAMAARLSGLNVASAEATFGIKVTGKGKFIVAEASAEASLSFKLVFDPKKPAGIAPLGQDG